MNSLFNVKSGLPYYVGGFIHRPKSASLASHLRKSRERMGIEAPVDTIPLAIQREPRGLIE